jgi:glycosyltransferase involved in cell wall biosynthesis
MKAMSSALFWPAAYFLKPDIVHETYYSPRPAYGTWVPRVLTVYDMIHERFRENFSSSDPVAANKRAAILRADHIFCISENTRRDLLDAYPIPGQRITVTYLAADDLPAAEIAAPGHGSDAPFLLYVGSRRGYKNFAGLLRAYASSSWLKNNFRMVCFGGGDFSFEERSVFGSLGLNHDHVLHLSGGDDRLSRVYRDAAIFIYPSLYEGFGIPLLEAMSLGCPIACSRTSSIPEVAGAAGEYFDPVDVESIQQAIEHVLQSSGRRNELIAIGHRQRQQFSWGRCAEGTLQGYRTVAG